MRFLPCRLWLAQAVVVAALCVFSGVFSVADAEPAVDRDALQKAGPPEDAPGDVQLLPAGSDAPPRTNAEPAADRDALQKAPPPEDAPGDVQLLPAGNDAPPRISAEPAVDRDVLQKAPPLEDAPGDVQLLPAGRDTPPRTSVDPAPETGSREEGGTEHERAAQEAVVQEEAAQAEREAEKQCKEEQERKEQERRAAREAATTTKEEAAQARREAEKLRKAEEERKDLESRAAREAAAAAKEEAAQARREAEKLRKAEEERKDLERRAAREAAAAAKEEAAQARREAEKAHKEEQERKKRERAAPAAPQERAVAANAGQIRELAYRAGLYAYPLVLADAVCRADALAARQAGGVDVLRQFFHSDAIPDRKRAPGILPRADSLYSLAWLDLKNSPYLLEVPAMPGRRHLVQVLDAWTKNLPALSAGNTGGKSGKYLLLLQGEPVPADYAAEYTPVFCPTSLCMLLARIQVHAPEDVSAARQAQRGLRLTPLFPARIAKRAESSAEAPVRQVDALDAEGFFSRFAGLLADNPAPARDARMAEHLALLGIAQGKKAFFSLDASLREAAAEGCRRALDAMGVYFNNMSAYNDPMDMGANGWRMSVMDVGVYGERYDMRAHLAAADFGTPRPQDVLQATLHVDADGRFLDGEHNDYVLRFEPGQLPPAAGFWSLTLYAATKRLHANAIERYALTSGSKLVTEADGATLIHLRQQAPDRKQRANWLPTPDLGYFFLVLRLYAPEARALQADWRPPKIARREKRKTVWESPAKSF
ncbi:MAG: DUF1214 domain-containing protein [Deltaproteobacteria bacterium]|jgi:hypothetical protein|nr:DUF1214 domain-containing protein [Deltaproteobacteria bacterium]